MSKRRKDQTTRCTNSARDCNACSNFRGCTKKVHCSCGGKNKDCRKCNGCGWRHPDGHSSIAYQNFHKTDSEEQRLIKEQLRQRGIIR